MKESWQWANNYRYLSAFPYSFHGMHVQWEMEVKLLMFILYQVKASFHSASEMWPTIQPTFKATNAAGLCYGERGVRTLRVRKGWQGRILNCPCSSYTRIENFAEVLFPVDLRGPLCQYPSWNRPGKGQTPTMKGYVGGPPVAGTNVGGLCKNSSQSQISLIRELLPTTSRGVCLI